jgi:hypothetical protein
MRKNYLAQAESLLGHFKPVNVDCAYTIAYALGQQDTKILLQDPLVSTTVRQIYAGTAYNMSAKNIKVQFYGGPVGRGKWFTGTLYSYLVDCIAAKIQMEGLHVTKAALRVGRPPF